MINGRPCDRVPPDEADPALDVLVARNHGSCSGGIVLMYGVEVIDGTPTPARSPRHEPGQQVSRPRAGHRSRERIEPLSGLVAVDRELVHETVDSATDLLVTRTPAGTAERLRLRSSGYDAQVTGG
jgi:hypothetical protein